MTAPRIILVTGKGGVGKTTTAAATAAGAARRGRRTLVMSTDAAHSLGDALELELEPGVLTSVERGLSALHVSPARRVEASWQPVRDYLREVLGGLGVEPVLSAELTTVPGADEIAALLELRARATSGEWDLIVLDCAPTSETLRLLALPESLTRLLQRVLSGGGLLRGLRPVAGAAAGIPIPGADVVEAITTWHAEMREVHELLSGETASVRLVLTPERVVIAESRRLSTLLSLHGYAVDAVVVNRMLPQAQADGAGAATGWLASWAAAQQAGLTDVRQSFDGPTIVLSAYAAEEPVGIDRLAELAAAWSGHSAILDDQSPTSSGVRVERVGELFDLALPLPHATAGDLSLTRRGDDLLVGVGDRRRVVALPSVLRRRRVTGAELRGGQLHVGFSNEEVDDE